jgi:multidrug efflux pump subunit AcrB
VWIVRLALRRPYTFVVLALLMAVLGVGSVITMSVDIFPAINIPVVNVIWQYSGLSPTEMEERILTVSERAFTTTVEGIEHIESVALRGVAVTRLYFHPKTPTAGAVAQLNAISQTVLRALPPGIFPPLIIQYNAASVPVILASLSSDQLAEQELNDIGNNFIRTQLVTIQGAQVPLPYGGKSRVVSVDTDPDALYVRGLSTQDVANAILTQNVILPAGTAKMGPIEYDVAINSSPEAIEDLNRIPIRYANAAMVYVGDVAFVHDGFLPQTNLVRRDGRHSALLPILSNGLASTLSIVKQTREMMPKVLAGLPRSLKVDFLFDQSIFVRAAITGVLHEGVIAACLTGLMILLFLHSWRSTLIVITSIPLSIMTSIIMLKMLGQSLNVMTLGGLALAVGILVDDATVEIENNHRQMDLGKPLRQAILDGAAEVATPAFVSTLSICIVFVPILFLGGVGGALFSPLGIAVVFAMLASYLLSRTLVPTMVLYLLRSEARAKREAREGHAPGRQRSFFRRASDRLERGFERLAEVYAGLLGWALAHPRAVMVVFLAFAAASLCLYPFVGRDFFPTVDAGQMRLHVRVPPATRIEETEGYFQRVEDYIRRVIPARELDVIVDNIGVPNAINLALSDNVSVGPSDGEILVALRKPHRPTAEYLKALREGIRNDFPDIQLFTQPADIVSQILNFGLPAPIDIQVTGPLRDADANLETARRIASELTNVPGAVDVHLQQVTESPRIMVDSDRQMAQQMGLSERDIANSLLISLTGSGTTTTNFWLNYKNGVSYQVVVQTPQRRVSSMNELQRTPIAIPGGPAPQILGNLADFRRTTTPLSLSHYNVQPVFDVYAAVQGTDLGSVSKEVRRIVAKYQKQVPKASSIVIRGQARSMNETFFQIGLGICFAVLLVYFLMMVNFQSWLDPLIILMALPGALSGILWALFVTRTTINVPSLMGCIMAIGVAMSNSILMITFANEQRRPDMGSRDALAAASIAGRTRLRPVLMTALAMLIGMLPMSLGLGEGGEQNAPLGRAVIGGLMVATAYTLFFVPVAYSRLRIQPPRDFTKVGTTT